MGRRVLRVTAAGAGAAVAVIGLLAGCTAASTPAALTGKVSESAAGGHDHGSTLSPPDPVREGESLVTIGLPRAYQPTAAGSARDDYRCFLVDPEIDEDRIITGVRFVPGNPDAVHHAILYRVSARNVSAAKARDATDLADGWTCFGGPGIPRSGGSRARDVLGGGEWLAAWAPGGTEVRYPQGTGVRLASDEQVVLQVHYNLAASNAPDRTTVELRTVGAGEGRAELETMLLVAPVELPCRPEETGPLCDRQASVEDTVERFGSDSLLTIWGLQALCGGDLTDPQAGTTQSCDHEVQVDGTVYAAAGHMHLLGRSIAIDLNPDTASAMRLLDVRAYDFDAQGARTLAVPVPVKRGDIVRVTCTHDTGLRALLPALADVEPRYVTWGEGTTDEMCLGILTYAPRT